MVVGKMVDQWWGFVGLRPGDKPHQMAIPAVDGALLTRLYLTTLQHYLGVWWSKTWVLTITLQRGRTQVVVTRTVVVRTR